MVSLSSRATGRRDRLTRHETQILQCVRPPKPLVRGLVTILRKLAFVRFRECTWAEGDVKACYLTILTGATQWHRRTSAFDRDDSIRSQSGQPIGSRN